MTKLLSILFGFGIVCLSLPLGTAIGAFVGWIVGVTRFGDWVLHTLSCLGCKGFTLAEFGALIGFVGSFFQATLKTK